MKKLFLILLFSIKLFAIGGINSLPENERGFVNSLKEDLDINEKDAFKMYTENFQHYLNESNWQMHWLGNKDPKIGKMGSSDVKTMFVSLINESRVVNFSLVKFPKISQVLIYSTETLPRKSSIVLDKFYELEKNSNFSKERESSNFAYFQEKGYMSKVNIFVSSPVGAVQYVNLIVFELKK